MQKAGGIRPKIPDALQRQSLVLTCAPGIHLPGQKQDKTQKARVGSSWLSEGAVAQVIEERIGQFRHQPPIIIRDSEIDVPHMSEAGAGGVAGATSRGKIYLLRDDKANVVDTVSTGRALEMSKFRFEQSAVPLLNRVTAAISHPMS